MYLEEIIKKKKERILQRKKELSLEELKNKVTLLSLTRDFKQSLITSSVAFIAEIKKASPSAGVIEEKLKPVEIAKLYEDGGANAISVITEEDYFQGSDKYLTLVKQSVNLPVLRKDFIFDPYQVYESRLLGADAILLIAAILDYQKLNSLLELTRQLKMEALVEVHTKKELEMTLQTDASIIGINNRNLKTFDVDLNTTFSLAKLVSAEKVIVSESGISTVEQIKKLKEVGVKAVLVGESLLRSKDIKAKLEELKT